MKIFLTYLSGLVFGLGIVSSGMANPAKVLNFFDVAGDWDPSLGLVMVSALSVAALGYRFVFRRPAPVFEAKFYVPNGGDIDKPLVLGSVIFGIGWGVSGFCPGGAIPAIGTGDTEVLSFSAALVAGMMTARFLKQRFTSRRPVTVRSV